MKKNHLFFIFLALIIILCIVYFLYIKSKTIKLSDFCQNIDGKNVYTNAFDNAIQFAVKNNKKNIIIDGGEYIIGKTIDLPSDINLIGKGNVVLKLKDNLKANTILVRLKGGQNNVITGLTFDGNADNLVIEDTPFRSEALINQSNTSKKTSNVRIENCIIKNTYSRGIRLVKAYNVVIRNNSFVNVGFDNVSILGESANVKIENNRFEYGKSVAIKAYGGVSKIAVSDNYINNFTFASGDKENNWSIGIEFTNKISDIVCTNNNVYNVGDMGISISKVNGGLCENNTVTDIYGGENNGLGIEIVQSTEVTVINNSIVNSSIKNAIISRSKNIVYRNNYSELSEDNKGNKNTQHIEISSKQNLITENCIIDGNTFVGGTRGILGGIAKEINICNNKFDDNYIAVDYGYYGGGENIKILDNKFIDNKEIIKTKDMINLVYANN